MKNICIIPARGGSKRIPKKNIKKFIDKPIIAYSIEAALKSNIFDEVMVSTDDEKIAEIAKEYGANVPFIRSSKNSDDFATTLDVINEVIEHYQSIGIEYQTACCLYATAPFVTSNLLSLGYNKLISNHFDSVFPIIKYSFPIQRALKIKDNKVEMFNPEHINTRSQDLEGSYHDSGQFYFFQVKTILGKGKMWTDNTSYITLNELEVQDIDTETDWKLAELKFKLLKE